jgi:hypothetical protein
VRPLKAMPPAGESDESPTRGVVEGQRSDKTNAEHQTRRVSEVVAGGSAFTRSRSFMAVVLAVLTLPRLSLGAQGSEPTHELYGTGPVRGIVLFPPPHHVPAVDTASLRKSIIVAYVLASDLKRRYETKTQKNSHRKASSINL